MRCLVHIGWSWIDTSSFSLYTISASVALQAISVISLGGVADHYRKEILLTFALLGSFSSTLFLPLSSTSTLWALCALFAAVANTSFGVSIVALNSYLPSLARGSPKARRARAEVESARVQAQTEGGDNVAEDDGEGDDDPDLESDRDALLGAPKPSTSHQTALTQYKKIVSQETSRISSRGIALGYFAGIFLLLILLIPVTKLRGSTWSLRLAIGMSGVWWLVFTIPAAVWLPNTYAKAERMDIGDRELEIDSSKTVKQEIVEAWKKLGRMLRPSEMRRLRNTFWYLAAWFLLSDGFTTITGTAVLFGKTVLHMSATALTLIGVIAPAAGIFGSLLWPRVQLRLGWSNLQALVALIALASFVPAYGCLGFLPMLRNGGWKFGGLTTPGEMYALAFYFGLLYGAFQGYARSVYAELVPPGEEARFFGLYSITDKSSSFLGPLLVGIISDVTGNIRYAFFFLVFMVLLPIPLLLFFVNVDQGREDAHLYSMNRRSEEH
jgi:UMF1 family MFS transporter